MQTVSLPPTIEHIPVGCFYQCPNLKSIKTKNKNLTYDKHCFFGCEKLKLKVKNISQDCYTVDPTQTTGKK